jgi:hypothetical protein
MHAPPDPHMRRPATRESDGTKSQEQLGSSKESDSTPIDFQARKLRQLFFFAHDTARTIAFLAFAGGPR